MAGHHPALEGLNELCHGECSEDGLLSRYEATGGPWRQINLAQVHAAISYYYENNNQIEAQLAEDSGSEEEHERRKAEYLRTAK